MEKIKKYSKFTTEDVDYKSYDPSKDPDANKPDTIEDYAMIHGSYIGEENGVPYMYLETDTNKQYKIKLEEDN
tara:strand:+ start:119042 stop:119260 length:219 start_codon:yes stop_codon:yes gene_type:complete